MSAHGRLALALTLFAATSAARAEPLTLNRALGEPENLKVSGSVRVRYEALDGQPRAGFRESDQQVAIRSILAAEYRIKNIRIGSELYDSRAYLAERDSPISTGEVNTFELVQAWVAADLRDAFGTGSTSKLQAGRFTLNLGSRRLVAADDYRNTTNGYTGLRADWKGRDGTTATLIYTLPQVRRPDDIGSLLDNRTQRDRESFDLRLWGGLIARPQTIGAASAELSYFRLQERDGGGRATRNRNLHTVGGRLFRDPAPGKLDYETEGFYQFGSIAANTAPTAATLDVEAWFVHGELGYSFAGPGKLRLSLEYDRASGDRPGGRFGRFDTLFGMRRAELAPAGIYNAVGRANLSSPAIRAELAPGKRFDAFAALRPMWLAAPRDAFSTTGVRDATGAAGNYVGTQLEGRVRYWLVPGLLRGEVSAVYLDKGRFLKRAPNAPRTGNTRYVATSITATF